MTSAENRLTEAVQLLKEIRSGGGMRVLCRDEREKDFVRTIRDRDVPRGIVSEKQLEWLRNIAADDPFMYDDPEHDEYPFGDTC